MFLIQDKVPSNRDHSSNCKLLLPIIPHDPGVRILVSAFQTDRGLFLDSEHPDSQNHQSPIYHSVIFKIPPPTPPASAWQIVQGWGLSWAHSSVPDRATHWLLEIRPVVTAWAILDSAAIMWQPTELQQRAWQSHTLTARDKTCGHSMGYTGQCCHHVAANWTTAACLTEPHTDC